MARMSLKERQKEKRKLKYLENVAKKAKPKIGRILMGRAAPGTKPAPFNLTSFSGDQPAEDAGISVDLDTNIESFQTETSPKPVFNRNAWGVNNG